jgi:hypothetical protein
MWIGIGDEHMQEGLDVMSGLLVVFRIVEIHNGKCVIMVVMWWRKYLLGHRDPINDPIKNR